MSVHQFPVPLAPMSEERMAEIRAAIEAPMLTLEELVSGPIGAISAPGPWVMSGDLIERIVAVALALQGPGRVGIGTGATALHLLSEALLKANDQ